jgi:nucleoredoxin
LANYPWRPRSVRQILGLDDSEGATLINKDGESKAVADVLGGVDVIALYFSAHWCGPCRQFTPKLAEQYKALKDAGKSFELVFVSSDKSADDMKEYMGEMPWWGLPFDKRGDKEELSNDFDVEGIPSLVFIDAKTGETITKNGRGGISAPTFVEDFPYYPKPVNDLSVTADGINENASLIVFLDSMTGEASKAEALAAIQAVAETAFKLREDDRTVGRFFTVKEKNELGDRVRQMCKLEDKKDSPQMVILDIPDNGGFYLSPATDASEASMNEFIDEFKNKSIARSQLS